MLYSPAQDPAAHHRFYYAPSSDIPLQFSTENPQPQDAGRLAAAEHHLRRATSLDPAAADAYNNLGTLLRSASRAPPLHPSALCRLPLPQKGPATPACSHGLRATARWWRGAGCGAGPGRRSGRCARRRGWPRARRRTCSTSRLRPTAPASMRCSPEASGSSLRT
jgi:hypothetical protein